MKNSMPLVSVIIPAYNSETFIRESIDSVLLQTYSNIELIVVDDGSTDLTPDIVKSYRNVTYVSQNNSGGCSAPRNNGFKYSSGEYISFFDSDDVMYPDKIEKQVEFLINHPEIPVVFVDYLNFDGNGYYGKSHFYTCSLLTKKFNKSKENYIELLYPESAEILSQENFTIASSPLYKRSVIEKLNGFDERLQASEDFDINYRTVLNYSIGIVSNVGFMRRIHNANMSSNTQNQLTNQIKCRKNLLKLEGNLKNKLLLKKFISVNYLNLSYYYVDKSFVSAFKCLYMAIYYRGKFKLTDIKPFIKMTIYAISFKTSFK